jgi:cysteinyl-tRNA synthetase
MKLYNSLTKKVEPFAPLHPPKVGLYTCGMTVYDFAHIGHGRKYVGDDLLRRILMRFGYTVTHVQNVTDVGHLSSDADSGEDKMEKGAKKYGKTVWEVAEFYTEHFYSTMDKLNIMRPTVICKATEHIAEQIALIQTLIAKGHAYDTPEAVYFDVESFAPYEGLFGRQKLADKKAAVRETVVEGEHKKHAADFALWFKRQGRFADHAMHWESPWGDGFPGWHIECSAMSMKYLGEQIDIHTGGIDHIPVHHPNEIAQSEGATDKQFVRFWVHYNFLRVDGKKMSKSLGNFYTVEDVISKNIDPLALRYFYLTAQYRSELNFTWEALAAANTALGELRKHVAVLSAAKERTVLSEEKQAKIDSFSKRFDEALQNDMNTPQALAVVWEMIKSNIPAPDKYDLLVSFDEVLGLQLNRTTSEVVSEIPSEITALVRSMEELRQEKKYASADAVRNEITAKGYKVAITPAGTVVTKIE